MHSLNAIWYKQQYEYLNETLKSHVIHFWLAQKETTLAIYYKF